MSGPPVKPPALARNVVERVLARAAELQARSSDDDTGLSEAQLVEIAGEVGLSPANVRQAIAEVRGQPDVPAESGAAHALLGTAVVQAARVVPGAAPGVLGAIDRWMQHSESLQVKRRFPDQMSWEPRQDFVTSIRRALHIGGRGFHLAGATEVRAVVATVEAKRAHAGLVADYSGARTQRTTAAIIASAIGVVVGVPGFWMAMNAGLYVAAGLALIPAVALPLAAMALARRAFRQQLARASVALEQALDRLEYSDSGSGG